MNKRMSKKHSTLFWLLLITGGWHNQAVADAVNNVSRAETVEQVKKQAPKTVKGTSVTLPELIYDSSEHFSDIDSVNLDGLLDRIGDSRLVLLGEATHGTAEFYDMRARITRELIENKGFNIVAVEADWPDAASIDYFIRGPGHYSDQKPSFKIKPFTGFPSWMWANHSVLTFTHWLKGYNQRFNFAEDAVGFYGLDLYNLFGSIEAVLDYLQDVDPKMAEVAGRHYACLMPWANDPSVYSRIMQSGKYRGCEYEVFTVLQDLLNNQKF